jgi:alkanesulfonate monooxygenase SsuD/methylene tetrahydromethanopterin reductase-like flavin-dependent oxidoreductase (luciferase family)
VAWGHAAVTGTNLGQGRFIVGDPATCIRAIQRYRQTFGITHFIMRMHAPGMDPKAVEHSMRLFAQHVMPAFAT